MNDVNEVWATIEEFPRYSVSSLGFVMNVRTEKLVKPHLNQQGGLYVSLFEDDTQHGRSLKKLVARAFVEGESNMMDTPICLDGDKRNNRADNLMWRPLWFAQKYARQFTTEYAQADAGPVYDMSNEERYETVRDAAMSNGLLFRGVFISTYTNAPVFPTDQVFTIPHVPHVPGGV